jgi:uncharacterized protein (DUF4415 family)
MRRAARARTSLLWPRQIRICKYIPRYNGRMAADTIDRASTRTPNFQQAANPSATMAPPPKVMVSLPLDADLVAYFQSDSEPGDWQRHLNDVLRFYLETNQMNEANAEFADARYQHEMPSP